MKEGFFRIIKCFNFKPAVPWIAAIVGLFFAVIGFSNLLDISEYIKEVLKWASATLLSGVIVGFMTTYAQFRGLFKNELEDVIYKYDFLKKRKDIVDIWESVSMVLFDSKFSEISDSLLKIIKERYLPIDHVHYCKDNDTIFTITWESKENGLIKVIQEDSFDIITASEKEFVFPGMFSIDVDPSFTDIEEAKFDDLKETIDCNLEITRCEINGAPHDYVIKKHIKGGVLTCSVSMNLKGSKLYSLNREITKIYNINHDNIIGFRAKTTLNNTCVRVFNEIHNDIDLSFISRGTLNNFNNVVKRKNYLEYEYKGLILQRQGYVIVLNQINKDMKPVNILDSESEG